MTLISGKAISYAADEVDNSKGPIDFNLENDAIKEFLENLKVVHPADGLPIAHDEFSLAYGICIGIAAERMRSEHNNGHPEAA